MTLARRTFPGLFKTPATVAGAWLFSLSTLVSGCGEVHHELHPPAAIGGSEVDSAPPLPPEPPPLPADMQAFSRDWLYCIYPRTHVVSDEIVGPTGTFYVVGFGLDPTPKSLPEKPADPPATPAAAPLAPPAPATSPTPPTPPTPPAPETPAPKAKTLARLVVLPGFPGDACDRNINGGSTLRATVGDVFGAVFGGTKFEEFSAVPVSVLPPGWSQGWNVSALDSHGRCYGFIVHSANRAAWCFGLCYAGEGNQMLRDGLLSRLDVRLGSTQRFDDLFTDYRIDTTVPEGWKSPGRSEQSRRWDAREADSHAFFIITNGVNSPATLCLECTGDDAARELAKFAELKDHPRPVTRQESRLIASLWASCGVAEVQLDTAPRPTTIGAWVFYDPVARKRFSVYYGYQLAAEKTAIDGMLEHLTRAANTPVLPDAAGDRGAKPATDSGAAPSSAPPAVPETPQPKAPLP
ncbi:MAG TPA: hypothetical protein VL860_11955 [Planctomycetota bacterium]|nr:hypothetical protein [Planctomycetota bacterium]